jgi:hypothetical protein
MLFMCHGEPRPGLTESELRRALQVFAGWKPPAGLEIKAHYVAAGGGDFIVVETSSAQVLIEAAAVWAPFLSYRFYPIAEVGEGANLLKRATEVLAQIQ